MSIQRPFKRTCRQLADGSYANNGHALYLLHKDFAQDPEHYIRAFLILQKDLFHLFEYTEPCDQNLNTISLRTHELLIRACVEIEANFTAILKENKYSKKGNFKIADYKIIDRTHRLSAYKVALPVWKGDRKIRQPFKGWSDGGTLEWYQAYNKSKHDRHANFQKATFNNLLDAVGGLTILLSAQFYTEEYSPNEKSLSVGGGYSYNGEDGMETAIGDYFRVLFPSDWPEEERYSLNYNELKNPGIIDQIDFDLVGRIHCP